MGSRIVENQTQQFLVFACSGVGELHLVMAEEDFDGAIAHATWSQNELRANGNTETKYYVLNSRSGIWYAPTDEKEEGDGQ